MLIIGFLTQSQGPTHAYHAHCLLLCAPENHFVVSCVALRIVWSGLDLCDFWLGLGDLVGSFCVIPRGL